MKPADADAIARFMNEGGQVRKVTATIAANEADVLAYLEGCGLPVKSVPGDMKPYSCRGRRYSLEGLVRFANVYRVAQELPPFTLARRLSAGSRSLRSGPFTSG